MENSYTPTPHNEAQFGEIARTVLMPGDPLRAKYIAENWLDHPICFISVRNMLGFTGTYQGKKVSVMGAGMGIKQGIRPRGLGMCSLRISFIILIRIRPKNGQLPVSWPLKWRPLRFMSMQLMPKNKQ